MLPLHKSYWLPGVHDTSKNVKLGSSHYRHNLRLRISVEHIEVEFAPWIMQRTRAVRSLFLPGHMHLLKPEAQNVWKDDVQHLKPEGHNALAKTWEADIESTSRRTMKQLTVSTWHRRCVQQINFFLRQYHQWELKSRSSLRASLKSGHTYSTRHRK